MLIISFIQTSSSNTSNLLLILSLLHLQLTGHRTNHNLDNVLMFAEMFMCSKEVIVQ